MKTGLEILPEYKREELRRIVELIRKEFDPEMIILFGSHARGTWVNDAGVDEGGWRYTYTSDFDIYVLMNSSRTSRQVERRQRIHDKFAVTSRTPVQMISDSVKFFNENLREGRYFFIDIVKEGILLYDSGRSRLEEPKELTVEQRLKLAEEYFESYFTKAGKFYHYFQIAFQAEDLAIAAFLLHQATENLYSTALLVLTTYKPRGHDIENFGKLAASFAPIFNTVFPLDTDEHKRLFELLKKAYIDARYKMNYKITREELEWLSGRVKKLQALTEEACRTWIEGLRGKQ
jgi:predicted nucleotidyltransferase/HEPN domain-containing protein